MEKVYRIAKWDEVFERAESRKLKQLHWIALPVKFSSAGYQSLLDEFGDEAPSVYGAWCALACVAANCSRRGLLASSRGIPLKISHIARMTGFRAALIGKLIDWASRPEVAWLVPADATELAHLLRASVEKHGSDGSSGESPDGPPSRQEKSPDTGQDITGQNKTGQDSTVCGEFGKPTRPPPKPAWAKVEGSGFVFVVASGSEWELPASKHAEYQQSFPEMDLEREYRTAAQWLRDNPKRRKTVRGMPAFLGAWLTRSQNRGGSTIATRGNRREIEW